MRTRIFLVAAFLLILSVYSEGRTKYVHPRMEGNDVLAEVLNLETTNKTTHSKDKSETTTVTKTSSESKVESKSSEVTTAKVGPDFEAVRNSSESASTTEDIEGFMETKSKALGKDVRIGTKSGAIVTTTSQFVSRKSQVKFVEIPAEVNKTEVDVERLMAVAISGALFEAASGDDVKVQAKKTASIITSAYADLMVVAGTSATSDEEQVCSEVVTRVAPEAVTTSIKSALEAATGVKMTAEYDKYISKLEQASVKVDGAIGASSCAHMGKADAEGVLRSAAYAETVSTIVEEILLVAKDDVITKKGKATIETEAVKDIVEVESESASQSEGQASTTMEVEGGAETVIETAPASKTSTMAEIEHMQITVLGQKETEPVHSGHGKKKKKKDSKQHGKSGDKTKSHPKEKKKTTEKTKEEMLKEISQETSSVHKKSKKDKEKKGKSTEGLTTSKPAVKETKKTQETTVSEPTKKKSVPKRKEPSRSEGAKHQKPMVPATKSAKPPHGEESSTSKEKGVGEREQTTQAGHETGEPTSATTKTPPKKKGSKEKTTKAQPSKEPAQEEKAVKRESKPKDVTKIVKQIKPPSTTEPERGSEKGKGKKKSETTGQEVDVPVPEAKPSRPKVKSTEDVTKITKELKPPSKSEPAGDSGKGKKKSEATEQEVDVPVPEAKPSRPKVKSTEDVTKITKELKPPVDPASKEGTKEGREQKGHATEPASTTPEPVTEHHRHEKEETSKEPAPAWIPAVKTQSPSAIKKPETPSPPSKTSKEEPSTSKHTHSSAESLFAEFGMETETSPSEDPWDKPQGVRHPTPSASPEDEPETSLFGKSERPTWASFFDPSPSPKHPTSKPKAEHAHGVVKKRVYKPRPRMHGHAGRYHSGHSCHHHRHPTLDIHSLPECTRSEVLKCCSFRQNFCFCGETDASTTCSGTLITTDGVDLYDLQEGTVSLGKCRCP